MSINGSIPVFNEATGSYENMHPESNWEQIKVSKTGNLKNLIMQESLIGTIEHNLNKLPIVQAFKYVEGAGVGGAGETGAGGSNPILDAFVKVEHTSFNSFNVRVGAEYLNLGDVEMNKHPDKNEYYFTFSNSTECICIVVQ